MADVPAAPCVEVETCAASVNIDENPNESDTVQSASKKRRNRRKLRPRKNELDSESVEAASIIPPFESLNLASNNGSNINGVSDEKILPDSKYSSNINIKHDENSGGVVSPSKKKKKRKQNVAIASIEKLSVVGKVKNSGHIPEESLVMRNESKKEVFAGVSQPLDAVKEKCGIPESRSVDQSRNKRFQNNKPSPKKVVTPGSKTFCNQTSSRSQQNSGSPLKQKRAHESRNTPKDESMLDENKFEPHLQTELVEVLLKEQPNVVRGFIRINQKNFREAYIKNPDGSKDILIDGVRDRNRALEGDEVAILILPESCSRIHDGAVQRVGKVINILAQIHHRQAVGNLKKMQDGNTRMALFSPRDSRIPRIRIPIKECPKNPKDWERGLFFARITEWDDVRYAKGRLIGDSFGAQGDIEAETRAIILENELICSPFEKKLYEYFPTPPFKLLDHHLNGREDLRKLCIFTIDPLTAKDLDDAVSCEKLSNGNFKVGVHISDVSFFLSEGTPLDLEVANRATTTYLVQRAYHMLPKEMTMMCSLLPGEDKLAFSVFWEMTPEAEVISHYFTRSVINSCTQLAYEHAQVMIDDPDHEWKTSELPKIYNEWTVEDLKERVKMLQSLAVIMRKRRFDTGALRIDQTKLSFILDAMGEPISISAYVNKESHRLIEEFMLLANTTVANALHQKFPLLAFLRCHDEPQPDMLKRLAEVLEKFGIVLDTESAGSMHQSLQRYCSGDDQARFVALNSLCSKPMTRARYFCAATIGDVSYMRHYALNVPLYTHFTSPIRRYADVMVHRLLAALLGYCDEPKWNVDFVSRVAANCNKMKFCAKRAGEQSAELFLALWVKNHGPVQEEAVVVDVKDRSFDAVVCSTGSNIRVYTDKLPGSIAFENTSVPQLTIQWTVAGGHFDSVKQVITTFSVVQVTLRSSNTNNLKIEAILNPPNM